MKEFTPPPNTPLYNNGNVNIKELLNTTPNSKNPDTPNAWLKYTSTGKSCSNCAGTWREHTHNKCNKGNTNLKDEDTGIDEAEPHFNVGSNNNNGSRRRLTSNNNKNGNGNNSQKSNNQNDETGSKRGTSFVTVGSALTKEDVMNGK